MWSQKVITLKKRSRGLHVITDEILRQIPELGQVRVGLLHLFLQHTSASLTINESVSPDVREDMNDLLDRLAPESLNYAHDLEGPDDLPAHFKSSVFGGGLLIPISAGTLLLGTWQGVYLGEHRDDGGARKVVATILGEE